MGDYASGLVLGWIITSSRLGGNIAMSRRNFRVGTAFLMMLDVLG